MSWEKLTNSKKEGDMGFRFVKASNIAILAKQWWRLMVNEESLMSRVIKARYFPKKSQWEAKKESNAICGQALWRGG